MNEFPEGIGKFEISASSVKSESHRNTLSDPNSSSIKFETRRNIPSDPNSMSLPSRLCECKCKVVLVQDLLECGVVKLEGANRRKAYCLFFKKDFLGRNEVDQKLSTQVPVGTELLANARLIREKSVIPFLATSVWEDGAIPDENELSKIFSDLESQEIEQYNMLSRDLGWFLPRDDCFSNDVNEGVTGDVNESNNNCTRYCKRKHNFREFSDEKKLNNEIGNIGRIKTEAVEIDYQQELKKCENQAEESLKLKREDKESTFGCSSNTKETGESISVRHSCSKGSSPTEEDRNEDEIYRGEKSKAMKDIAIKVLNKTTEDVHKPPIHTQLIPDRRNIVNGKGKILKILNRNYGIAIVLGRGRLCKVLFDIYDVLIEGQVCADLGKTLHEVMQEGDLVCLHAICIENPPISSTDQQIEYMATEIARASSVEELLNMKLPADGSPSFLEEVSPDKIKNFHQVAKVVLATQGEEEIAKSMEKNEIPVDMGILWKRWKKKKKHHYVDFFCFHCKYLKHPWKEHNKHVLTCQDLKCLERGEELFQRMKEESKTTQVTKESGAFNKPQSMATENEEVLQEKEKEKKKRKKRLKTSVNAGKNDSNKFHCQYEGKSMSHFTRKKHQDLTKYQNYPSTLPYHPSGGYTRHTYSPYAPGYNPLWTGFGNFGGFRYPSPELVIGGVGRFRHPQAGLVRGRFGQFLHPPPHWLN